MTKSHPAHTTNTSDDDTVSIAESGPSRGRLVAIACVIIAFVALFIASASMNKGPADQVWNSGMTVGSSDASRLYIMYTDLACPYCDVFSRAAMDHWDKFLAYLDEHHILFEIRLTDTLYEGNGYQMSRDSAEAAYCANREGKFWEYYHGALQALWDDYHSKGIGNNKTATPITGMPDDYWLKIGHRAGLGEDFDKCVAEHATLSEVEERTAKASAVAQGMPTFKFGKFTTSGFSDTWGWDYVQRYLDAGL